MDQNGQVILPVYLKRLRMDGWWNAKGITMKFMKDHCNDSRNAVIRLINMIEEELASRQK
jgi:hypothetical protein